MDDLLDSSLHHLAINAALNCQWEEAIKLNQQIIQIDPVSITSLNRLARAFCELGRYKEARKIYQEVIGLDPYNSIALKNFKKIAACKDNDGVVAISAVGSRTLSASMFLQEPGITKMVNLIKIAEPSKLLTLSAGALVNLVPKTKNVAVVDQENRYLGVLPDDTAFMLLRLIKGGNKYQAIIKSVRSNAITVLIREIFRAKRFRNQPSFLDESRLSAYSSDNLPLIGGDDGVEAIEETDEVLN